MPAPAPTVFTRRTKDGWFALGGAVVVAVCMVMASSGEVGELEASVFRAINGLPDWMSPPLDGVQLLGGLVVPVVLAVIPLLGRRFRLALALALVAPFKLLVEKGIIKALVERERPGTTVTDAILRGDVPAEGLSFPSGHVIIAFAVAVIVAAHLGRRWTYAAFVIAVLVAISRVYLGAHLPLDVLAGAAAGVVVASALNLTIGVPAGAGDRAGVIS